MSWSVRTAPSADCDYCVSDGHLLRRAQSGQSRFAGHSLAVGRSGDFAICGTTAEVDDLRLLAGGIISTRMDNSNNRLKGTATVLAPVGNPFGFEIECSEYPRNSRRLYLDAELKGSGDLRFRYYSTASVSSFSCSPRATYYVDGSNPSFTGGIELFQPYVAVQFKDELAMGGPAAEFRADRLRFTSNAVMRVGSSFVMSDPTRGIMFGEGVLDGPLDGGTIEVTEGNTLVISNLISGTTSFRKAGSGDLVICCPTNAFSGTVRNRSDFGVLAVGSATALANASLQGRSNSVWRVDAPEGMTVKSLDAIVGNVEDGNRSLLVRPLAFANVPKGESKVVANLVRFLGATAADAETALSLVRLDPSSCGKSWKVTLSAEEADGALLVTATAERPGMTVIIR